MMIDSLFYILDGHRPAPCPDLLRWAAWIQTHDFHVRVALDEVENLRISTVFLGMNHNYWGGPPILFETLVFVDGEGTGTMRRYSTWEEAETGHRWVVNEARMHLDKAGERTTCLLSHLLTLTKDNLP